MHFTLRPHGWFVHDTHDRVASDGLYAEDDLAVNPFPGTKELFFPGPSLLVPEGRLHVEVLFNGFTIYVALAPDAIHLGALLRRCQAVTVGHDGHLGAPHLSQNAHIV